MKEQEIIQLALENLHLTTGIEVKWKKNTSSKTDGQIIFKIEGVDYKFNVLVKKELRNYQIANIQEKLQQEAPILLVAENIFPKIKEELRQLQISFLETNGNIFLKQKGIYIWIDAQKTFKLDNKKGNRAFTKTGLVVVFDLLKEKELIKQTYRDIAATTEVGLGNINYIVTGLKELGFAVKVNKTNTKLVNQKDLYEKWINAYEERLKPSLHIGTFRFLNANDFINWKNISLGANTYWGGEPAADLLTNYLHPEILTIYTAETRNEIMKKYGLIPDEKGNIKVYKKFWHYDDHFQFIAPALLIYADLINTNDRRCIETAKKIYYEFLQNQF